MTPEQQHDVRNALCCCKFYIRRLREYILYCPSIYKWIDYLECQLIRIDTALNFTVPEESENCTIISLVEEIKE